MSLLFGHGTFEVSIFKGGLTYNKKNSNGSEGAEALFKSISSVRVKLMSAGVATIAVEITPSMDDAFKVLSSGLLGVGASYDGQKGSGQSSETSVAPTNLNTQGKTQSDIASGVAKSVVPYVAVKFFYPDETMPDGSLAETPWFGGNAATPPDVSFDGSEVTFTINASGAFKLLNQIEGTHVFKDKPLYEVITEIAKQSGTKIVIESGDSETLEWLKSKNVTGAYNDVESALIKRLLKEADCVFVVDSGTEKQPQEQIRIRKRSSIASSDIRHTFVVWRQPDVDSGQYPVLSLNVDGFASLFTPGAIFGTQFNAFDTSKKKVETSFFGADDEVDKASPSKTSVGSLPESSGDGVSVGGANGLIGVDATKTAGASMAVMQTADANTKNESESNSRESFTNSVKMRFTVPGIPDLRPMIVSQIIFGDNYPGLSGPGIINSIEHISDSDGWKTEVMFNRSDSITTAAKKTGFIKSEVPKAKQSGTDKTAKVIP